MSLVDTNKAAEYFQAKMAFTTGPVELKHMIDSIKDINIIDVRASEDYAAGHIPGSTSLPKDKWNTLEGLAEDKNNIVYCYSSVCHLAAAAALHFAKNGYPVMELEGGFDEWKKFNFPIET